MTAAEQARFLQKIRFAGADECWIWEGPRIGAGYGEFNTGYSRSGTKERAHRTSWRLHVGPIPEGLHVLHKCDNPPCVNPAHLFLGTARDNAHDRTRKGRTHTKLTREQVDAIRRLHNADCPSREIAARFGVSQGHICKILNGSRWNII